MGFLRFKKLIYRFMKYLMLYESHKNGYSIQDWIDDVGEKNLANGQTHRGHKRLETLLEVYHLYTHKSPRKLTTLKGIEKFENLRSLSCHGGKLKDLKGLEYCTKLNDLVCWGNKLTSLKEIKNLTKITRLFCHTNPIGTLKDLENLVNMEHLECNDNNLDNLKGIENMKKLDMLTCDDNNLKNLEEIRELSSLEYVSCKNNPLEYPLWIENCNFHYDDGKETYFKTYDFQKKFLTEYPEKVSDLKQIGYAEGIKQEFPSLFTGMEWGFFELKDRI